MSEKGTELDVQRMTCSSCVHHVSVALAELEGVSKVEVRLREGRVLVQHDPVAAPVQLLVDTLAGAGYESTPSAAA